MGDLGPLLRPASARAVASVTTPSACDEACGHRHAPRNAAQGDRFRQGNGRAPIGSGQGLGTHGDHGRGLYEEDILVPLVFAGPGTNRNACRTWSAMSPGANRRNLLNLASAEVAWDGRTLVPAMFGRLPASRSSPRRCPTRTPTTTHGRAPADRSDHDLKRQTLTLYNLTEDPMERPADRKRRSRPGSPTERAPSRA